MVKRKLRLEHFLLMTAMTLAGLTACRAEGDSIGWTLVYECEGPKIVVSKFQAEGMRAGGPGVVGCGPKGGKQMAFMPGDAQGNMPTYADISWSLESPESELEGRALMARADKYRSEEWFKDQRAYQARLPKFDRRIDFGRLITPELIERVRANAQTTQLKLIMMFKGDKLEVKAAAYKWR